MGASTYVLAAKISAHCRTILIHVNVLIGAGGLHADRNTQQQQQQQQQQSAA